jgi:hypothetical protein
MNIICAFPTNVVTSFYADTGIEFGEMVNRPNTGKYLDFETVLKRLEIWETQYARRGFRTISIDDFERAEGQGEDISGLLGVQREDGEDAVLHVKLYREHFLGKVDPVIEISR